MVFSKNCLNYIGLLNKLSEVLSVNDMVVVIVFKIKGYIVIVKIYR